MRLSPLLIPASIMLTACNKDLPDRKPATVREYSSDQQDKNSPPIKDIGSVVPSSSAGLKVTADAVLSCVADSGEIPRQRGPGLKPAACDKISEMEAQFTSVKDDVVTMKFVKSGKCLGVAPSVEDGADVKGVKCTSDKSQQWRMQKFDSKSFRLISVADPELCMFMESAENTFINRVYYCSDSPNQVFTFVRFTDKG